MNTLHQPPEQRNLRKLAGFLTSAYIDKAAEVTGEADVGELGRDVLPVKTQDIGTVVEFQVAHGSREFLQHVVGVSHGAGLVPEFVVFHPVFDLLIGHVEVAFLLVQGGHFGHFFRAQFKVEDRDVLLDVFGVGGSGNHAEALLDVPTDDNLGGRFAMGLGDFIDDRVAEDFTLAVTAAEREPALNLDAVFLGHFLPVSTSTGRGRKEGAWTGKYTLSLLYDSTCFTIDRFFSNSIENLVEDFRKWPSNPVNNGPWNVFIISFCDTARDAGKRVAVTTERNSLADGIFEYP